MPITKKELKDGATQIWNHCIDKNYYGKPHYWTIKGNKDIILSVLHPLQEEMNERQENQFYNCYAEHYEGDIYELCVHENPITNPNYDAESEDDDSDIVADEMNDWNDDDSDCNSVCFRVEHPYNENECSDNCPYKPESDEFMFEE